MSTCRPGSFVSTVSCRYRQAVPGTDGSDALSQNGARRGICVGLLVMVAAYVPQDRPRKRHGHQPDYPAVFGGALTGMYMIAFLSRAWITAPCCRFDRGRRFNVYLMLNTPGVLPEHLT
jgi:hypothetical protein